MLQVKNLVKRYTTKGETVTALDGVSVDFPETGMVFLLGKSGSGKSTLLNVAGGLDAPDEGEIVVKGKSSKEFSGSDFDSYRNTYVGFIFQEYNILTELTVEENVALAIELQGKPRDPALVEELLERVDLKGLGDRRPNTLSGGQKQRVAIARALVKNPEIIMADEPTGALDSATGAQVFDTLKKLSEQKLVVVVSHDREFAEKYADRIIELKDGKIVSDVTRGEASAAERTNLKEWGERKLSVSSGATLSDAEISRIVSFLKKNKGGVVISSEKEDVAALPEESSAEGFRPSEPAAAKREENTASFIRSRFPFRYACKMGVSGLRFKPVRLAFTALLATIAFIVFGFFSTLVTFDKGKIGAASLEQSAFTAAVFEKRALIHVTNPPTGEGELVSTIEGVHFLEGEAEVASAEYPELDFFPVFNFDQSLLDLAPATLRNDATYPQFRSDNFHDAILLSGITGFAEASCLEGMEGVDLVAGRLPEAADEAVVSAEIYGLFEAYGLTAYEGSETVIVEPKSYEDLLGKIVSVRIGYTGSFCDAKICGIVDTHERFDAFREKAEDGSFSDSDSDALEELFRYSLSSVFYVHEGFYDKYRTLDRSAEYYERNVLPILTRRNGIGPFAGTTYESKYREESESANRYQYLFASLGGNRAEKCSVLLRRANEKDDFTLDRRYRAPYSLVSEITRARQLIDNANIFPILGSAAGILAAFAALLLFNFISASINAKKKDVGILRAVGARGIDVFKIFVVEAFVVTLACFALGCFGCWAACAIVNDLVAGAQLGLSFNIFYFDILNALMVLGIAFATALVATIVPVALTVRKKPVEAIRAI